MRGPFAEMEKIGGEGKKTTVCVKFEKTIQCLTAIEAVGRVWSLGVGGAGEALESLSHQCVTVFKAREFLCGN